MPDAVRGFFRYPTIMDNIDVLIVDDLPHVRQSLANVLELASMKKGLGIQVIGEAQNGIEAIQQAHILHPDVILMDLEMPCVDGFEAARAIKQADPGVGIIVLTIHYDPDSRRKAQQAGADAFLEKGAPLEELIETIHKFRRKE